MSPGWDSWGSGSNMNVMKFIFFNKVVVLVSNSEVLGFRLTSVESTDPPSSLVLEEVEGFFFGVTENAFFVLSFFDSGVFEVDTGWTSLGQQIVDSLSLLWVQGVLMLNVLVSLNPVPVSDLERTLGFSINSLVGIQESSVSVSEFSVLSLVRGVVDIVSPSNTLSVELSLSQLLDDIGMLMPVKSEVSSGSEFTVEDKSVSPVVESSELVSEFTDISKSTFSTDLVFPFWDKSISSLINTSSELSSSEGSDLVGISIGIFWLRSKSESLTSEDVVSESSDSSDSTGSDVESGTESWGSQSDFSSTDSSGLGFNICDNTLESVFNISSGSADSSSGWEGVSISQGFITLSSEDTDASLNTSDSSTEFSS